MSFQKLSDLTSSGVPEGSSGFGKGWSEELDDLSPRSKNIIVQELYGKRQLVDEEEPSFLESKLKQLDAVLTTIPVEEKKGYMQAEKLNPSLKTNRSQRMQFLRAEQFDAGLAAHRLTQYFDFTLEWFGERGLTGRSISLTDLDEFDHHSLKSGGIQILAKKDSGNRNIMFYRPEDLRFKTGQNVLRTALYMLTILAADEDAQKRGLVFIVYANGKGNQFKDAHMKILQQLGTFLSFGAPIRVAGLHFLYDNPVNKEVARYLTSGASRAVRLRFVTHESVSHQELSIGLMKYGIPEDAVPVREDGRLDRGDHLQWLERRIKTEAGGGALTKLSFPTGASALTISRVAPPETAQRAGTVAPSPGPRPIENQTLLLDLATRQSSVRALQRTFYPPTPHTTNDLILLNNLLAGQTALSNIQNKPQLTGGPVSEAASTAGDPSFQFASPQFNMLEQNVATNPNMMALLFNSYHLNQQTPQFVAQQGQQQLSAQQTTTTAAAPPPQEILQAHSTLPGSAWFPNQQMAHHTTSTGMVGFQPVASFPGASTASIVATSPASSTLPNVLFLESDIGSLSDYQCFLRQQIEAFEASNDDVQYNASRMNRSIVSGQVGLRCRHCTSSPEWERASGAVYYPGSLSMLYQAGQNMAKNHLCTTCKKIPKETRDLLNLLRGDKRRATAGKEYWSKTAKILGIYEDGKSGLKHRIPVGTR